MPRAQPEVDLGGAAADPGYRSSVNAPNQCPGRKYQSWARWLVEDGAKG